MPALSGRLDRECEIRTVEISINGKKGLLMYAGDTGGRLFTILPEYQQPKNEKLVHSQWVQNSSGPFGPK
jgi:hypothetical protein